MDDYEALPICHDCGMRYSRADAGWMFNSIICGTCELIRFETFIHDLVTAKSKPDRRKAIKALERLSIQ